MATTIADMHEGTSVASFTRDRVRDAYQLIEMLLDCLRRRSKERCAARLAQSEAALGCLAKMTEGTCCLRLHGSLRFSTVSTSSR